MNRWGEVGRWVVGLELFYLTYRYILNECSLVKIIIVRRVMETISYFLTSKLTI